MERTGLKPEEREAVKEWAGDERWVKREAWKADEAYVACVRDIMEHPVFLSMDGYYQHGRTTCREHCIRVSYLSYRLCRKYGMICFCMTGIRMQEKPEIIFMDSPIPELRWRMQSVIFRRRKRSGT